MKKHQHNLRKIFQPSKNLSEQDFQNYLEDNLSADERYEIENTLIDDPFAAEALEGFQDTNFDFNKPQPYQNVDNFLSKMEAAHEAKVVTMQPRILFRRIAIAASLALILAAGAYIYSGGGSMSNEELFAQHYATYESDLPNFRGGVDDEVTIIELLNRGMQEYVNGNFEASLPFFTDFLNEDSKNPIGNFYAGIANLESGKIEQAMKHLQITSNLNADYAEKAKWYLILANLKKGDRAKAQQLLAKYVESGNAFNQSEAVQLLQNL